MKRLGLITCPTLRPGKAVLIDEATDSSSSSSAAVDTDIPFLGDDIVGNCPELDSTRGSEAPRLGVVSPNTSGKDAVLVRGVTGSSIFVDDTAGNIPLDSLVEINVSLAIRRTEANDSFVLDKSARKIPISVLSASIVRDIDALRSSSLDNLLSLISKNDESASKGHWVM